MTIETQVADHYTTGALTERVKQALRDLGIDPDRATADDLKACDEFHTGGFCDVLGPNGVQQSGTGDERPTTVCVDPSVELPRGSAEGDRVDPLAGPAGGRTAAAG